MSSDYINFIQRMGLVDLELRDEEPEFEEELEHHGVLGMKWGVRKDRVKGGLSRNGQNYRQIAQEGAKIGNSAAEGLRRTRPGRMPKQQMATMKSMTDQQLRDKINRMNMEQQYSRMVSSETKINRGKAAVTDTMQIAGTALGIGASALSIALSIQKLKK